LPRRRARRVPGGHRPVSGRPWRFSGRSVTPSGGPYRQSSVELRHERRACPESSSLATQAGAGAGCSGRARDSNASPPRSVPPCARLSAIARCSCRTASTNPSPTITPVVTLSQPRPGLQRGGDDPGDPARGRRYTNHSGSGARRRGGTDISKSPNTSCSNGTESDAGPGRGGMQAGPGSAGILIPPHEYTA
jgi:hypothetical protein